MKRPPGSHLLPFPPKSAVAPFTQPQQHFFQISAPTQQMGQGSQPALALTKKCWIAVPSITHPSGADGSQQHPSCPLACPPQVLLQKHLAEDPTLALYKRPALSPCPSTEAALTPAGLEGRCSFCKGESWVDQGPLLLLPACDQLHWASLHPALEHQGPLSPPAATAQFKSALLLYGKNFLIPCGAPHSFMALTHCSTAWLPQVTLSINPTTAEL